MKCFIKSRRFHWIDRKIYQGITIFLFFYSQFEVAKLWQVFHFLRYKIRKMLDDFPKKNLTWTLVMIESVFPVRGSSTAAVYVGTWENGCVRPFVGSVGMPINLSSLLVNHECFFLGWPRQKYSGNSLWTESCHDFLAFKAAVIVHPGPQH